LQPNNYSLPIQDVVNKALVKLGYAMGDVNAKERDGGFSLKNSVALNNNWRYGTYRSYVEPILTTTDICVLTFAHVDRIILDHTKGGLRATGVALERFGERLTYRQVI
jgi:choline dehydrogenase-like flavoprotein